MQHPGEQKRAATIRCFRAAYRFAINSDTDKFAINVALSRLIREPGTDNSIQVVSINGLQVTSDRWFSRAQRNDV